MLKDKLKGMLYGGIVGDILGVPFEFKDRGTFNCTDMVGYGTHNQPVGTWSDDTSMTLATIDNIIQNGTEIDLMFKFLEFRNNGKYTPHGKVFDIGSTVVNAIDEFEYNISNGINDVSNCGQDGEYDNGNGALMRISPIITILDEYDSSKSFDLINRYTSLTHSYPRSVIASIIYLELLQQLLEYDKLESIENVFKITQKMYFPILPFKYVDELSTYNDFFNMKLLDKQYSELKSSGYVVDTLFSAIWCFYYSNSFEDAVLKAVNLGGDTDTIASITGSLAGIYYGYDSIPKKWINKIVKKDYIDALINAYLDLI